MRFAQSVFLLLVLIIPFLVKHYRERHRRRAGSLRFSNISRVQDAVPLGLTKYYGVFSLVRIVTIILLILALARPQSSKGDESVTTEGIDIILTLDVSGSMQAEDFKPNRLEAAKQVANQFIRERDNDRIGLVVFAGHSATQVPLTLDYDILLSALDHVHLDMLQEDGTAIGMAIANSVNRLRNSTAKSRIIILLTDGVNNKGEIDPLTAANLAQAMKVKIYTIGAGSQGEAYVTMNDPFWGERRVPIQAELDEHSLKEVANITEGAYFRATDKKSLAQIYDTIEQLEKSKIDVKQYKEYVELFPYLAYAAMGLLCLEIVLKNTRFRKTP